LDQRGYGRPASGSSICDIGAFEFGATDISVPASLSSGQAKKVGTGRPNGTLRLAFTALLPRGLDLSQATLRIQQVLAERGAELVELSPDPGLDLQRLEGAKRDRASFATLDGEQPLLRLQLRSRGGVLEGTLRLDQAEVAAPRLCGIGATELTGEMVV